MQKSYRELNQQIFYTKRHLANDLNECPPFVRDEFNHQRDLIEKLKRCLKSLKAENDFLKTQLQYINDITNIADQQNFAEDDDEMTITCD